MGRSSEHGKRPLTNIMALGTALFALLFGLVVLIAVQLLRFESERHQQREIEQVAQQLDSLATALKNRIYANIFAVSGVKSLVAMNPELTQEDFSRAMEIQFREHSDLRNIGLAREMILRLMYPVEGNEAAIGLDYRSLPDQIAAVEEALELNRIVLAGPLALVQGGEGLIARIPIHVTDAASGQERFWGFASVVMNADAILAGAGIRHQDALRLGIRGRDGRGEDGEVFFGDPGVFYRQPVTQLIELPHGSWQMAAEPAGGWTRYSAFSDPSMWAYLAVALSILGFAAVTVFLLTQNRATGEALRIAEERLEKTAYELTENIPVGTYTMVQDAEGGMARFAFMSSRFLELTGLTREEAASDPMKGFACVHPDDMDAWVALNVESFNEKKPFFGEARVVVNGEVRWITAESFPRSLSDGTTVWEGVLADVTDRKQAEQALSESLMRFNDLVDRVSVGVYVFWRRADGTMEFEYVSDSWCEMNQIRREDLLQNPQLAWDVIHPDEFEAFRQLNEQVARERRPFAWEGRIIINGAVRFVLIESTPVFFGNGDSRWFGFEQDITARKHAEATLQETNLALAQEISERSLVEQQLKLKTELLEKLSMQDGLTGIANRRYFDQRSDAEWKRVVRTGLPLSLMLIDIDHFKSYNDHYGHGAGDDCLRQVARALAGCGERPLDLVARYGGEEFVALVPETGLHGARHLAEQMRAAVDAMAIPHADSSAAAVVTVSIGVAAHEPGRVKRDLRHLQECADQALYRAKHQGRNQVQEEVASHV